MAKLYYRYGAMNCGKTAILLQAVHNYEEQGMQVLVTKPAADTKGGDTLVSRIGLTRKIDYLIGEQDNIYDYVRALPEKISCVFVDEAQFLEPEQVDQLMQIVIKLNIPVMSYGLRLDFQGKGFPGSTRLLEIAHTIEEIKTICTCGRKAMFNVRKINGKFVFDGNQIAIDGKDSVSYEPLCPNCFYDKLEKYNKLKKNLK